MRAKKLSTAIILLFTAAAASAATRLVPAQYPNIQTAIDDCNNGDTVIVAPGTYTGPGNRDIDFRGKPITVRSENGPENCIIDCSDPERWYAHRGFCFHSGEDANSVLRGFTITNGRVGGCPRSAGGGAILCSSSSPTISDCIIVKNWAVGVCRDLGSAGGGIFLDQSSPAIANCMIVGNVSNEGGEGAGIFCRQSSPVIANCTVCDNSGDGIMCYDGSCPVIINCVFWANSSRQIVGEPGGSYIRSSTPFVVFSNVQGGWPGLGDIAENPHFVSRGYWDPNNNPYSTYDDFWVDGDYHLMSEGWRWDAGRRIWTWDTVTSRCIDAGDPDAPLRDEPLFVPVDPTGYWGVNLRINMGAYGGTAEASIPPHGWAIRTDYNNDGILNFTDFAYWSPYANTASQWGSDHNYNCTDLVILAESWLNQTDWFKTPSPGVPFHIPIPGQASAPNPPDGAVGIRLDPVLGWQAGAGATSHDVYFGASNPPTFQARTTATTFAPGTLSKNTTYYWRIDEVNPFAKTAGPVWRFTTGTGSGGR